MLRRCSHSPVARAVAAYGLILLSWLLSTPPFSGTDEWSHYLRAIGIAHGSWIGQKIADSDSDISTMPDHREVLGSGSPDDMDLFRQLARVVHVPPGMSPDGYGCNAFHHLQSARCNDAVTPVPVASEHVTPVGIYIPTFYLVPALISRAASTALGAMRILRTADAMTCLILLAIALLCAYDASCGGSSLLGVALAATPMALSLGAILNPNSPEIFAGIAFGCSLIRLLRDEPSPPRWVYLGAAASGASLALARSLGPAWVALYLLAFALIAGNAKLRALWRADRLPLLALTATLAIACAGNRLWQAAHGAHIPITVVPTLTPETISPRMLLSEMAIEAIGYFQYLDTPMPGFAYKLYPLAFGLVIIAALWRATSRERFLFAFCAVSIAVVPLALYYAFLQGGGFALQGRYVLPYLVIAPVFAGELLRRHWSTLHPRVRTSALASIPLISFLQFIGLYAAGRRSAVGLNGPKLFWHLRPEWRPPGGWDLSLGLAAIGCALLATALAAGSRPKASTTAPA